MTSNFNLNILNGLDHEYAKKYLTKYFVPLDNGNHCMLVDGKYIIRDDQEIKKSFFNRMNKDLQNYYLKQYFEVKTITYEFGRETFYDNKINLCPKILHQYEPDYIITDEVKEKRDIFLNYILEVLCSGDKACNKYILCWLSNLIKGKKNNSCLYLKGGQGMGKSTLFEMLNSFIIGKDLCLETGSDPIRTKFNEILAGKLCVCFEELENFSRAEWESISSTLKRNITSSRINFQNKCSKAYVSNNINNYILISNNDAIKDDDGRRYFILDISPSKVGNKQYWNTIYSCFTNEVGKALYQFLYEVNTADFNPQTMPLTKSKKDSHTKRLDQVYRFIKDRFVLHKKPIKLSCNQLYTEYKFTVDSSSKICTKEDFHKKLADIGFMKIKKHNNLFYNETTEKLYNMAMSNNWISEYDEFDTETETDPKISPLDIVV